MESVDAVRMLESPATQRRQREAERGVSETSSWMTEARPGARRREGEVGGEEGSCDRGGSRQGRGASPKAERSTAARGGSCHLCAAAVRLETGRFGGEGRGWGPQGVGRHTQGPWSRCS